MLVINNESINRYVADGIVKLFPITFQFLNNDHVAVYRYESGTLVKVDKSEYTISGAGSELGGQCEFTLAPVSGIVLAFVRDVPITQLTQYSELDNFPAESHENALSKLTMICQMLAESLTRALILPVTSDETPQDVLSDIFAIEPNVQQWLKEAGTEIYKAESNVQQWLKEVGTEVGSHSYVTPSGATRARTLADRFADTINVKDFGAVGDGVTDDTAAIQAAINSGAKSIYFPSGYYGITAGIVVNNHNTTLFGDGPFTSQIHALVDGITCVTFTRPNGKDILRYCGIYNLGIAASDSLSNVSNLYGLRLVSVARSMFTTLLVVGMYGGIQIVGGGDTHFSSITVYANYNFGAFRAGSYLVKVSALDFGDGTYKNPGGINFDTFEIRSSADNTYLDYGIVVESCDGLWFTNGHVGIGTVSANVRINPVINNYNIWVIGLRFTGVHFDGGTGRSNYCLLYTVATAPNAQIRRHTYDGCHFGNAQVNCVDVKAVNNIVFSGCRFNAISSSEWMIKISNSQHVYISGTGDARSQTGITGGAVTLNTVSFAKVDLTLNEFPIGVKLVGNTTRAKIDCIYGFCDVPVDTSELTNTVNEVIGMTNTPYNAIASASEITLPFPYKVFNITGTTTINTIASSSEMLYREVILRFNAACTVTDGASIKLAGPFTSTSGSTLTLMYDGDNWVEISRAIV